VKGGHDLVEAEVHSVRLIGQGVEEDGALGPTAALVSIRGV
jgi:hypothetical protein